MCEKKWFLSLSCTPKRFSFWVVLFRLIKLLLLFIWLIFHFNKNIYLTTYFNANTMHVCDVFMCELIIRRKESDIVRSSTWTKCLKWIVSIVPNNFAVAAVICAFLRIWQTCCFSLHWFFPLLLLSSSGVNELG